VVGGIHETDGGNVDATACANATAARVSRQSPDRAPSPWSATKSGISSATDQAPQRASAKGGGEVGHAMAYSTTTTSGHHYRIKSIVDGHERAVGEGELIGSLSAPG
jgi:hypothetical protein